MRWEVKQLVWMSLLIAIGVVTAPMIWFPAGVAKAFPMQHAINVIAAVSLGPVGAVTVAFMIGLLRNLLGLGTILAFPGGMIGAFFAGWLFKKTKKLTWTVFGEVLGTGIIGALLSVPIAQLFLGKAVAALFFIPSFFVSSLSGGVLSFMVLSLLLKNRTIAEKMLLYQERKPDVKEMGK